MSLQNWIWNYSVKLCVLDGTPFRTGDPNSIWARVRQAHAHTFTHAHATMITFTNSHIYNQMYTHIPMPWNFRCVSRQMLRASPITDICTCREPLRGKPASERLPTRVSEREVLSVSLRGFERLLEVYKRLSEVLRGFEWFSDIFESPLRDPLRVRFPSQRLSVLLPLFVLPLQLSTNCIF